MKLLLGAFLLFGIAAFAGAHPASGKVHSKAATKSSKPSHQSAKHSSSARSSSHTSPSRRSTARGRSARGRHFARARKPSGPSYQTHPTPERYKEIQQALADKGYFKGAVDGEWGSDSVDALKRFQADRSLSDDGKISALSLIGLGLGPHQNHAAATPGTSGQTAAGVSSAIAPVAGSSGVSADVPAAASSAAPSPAIAPQQ